MRLFKKAGFVLFYALVLFSGCNIDNPADTSSTAQPGTNGKKVYLGGSMIVAPGNAALNQLYEGMNVPIRMVEYRDNGTGGLEEARESVRHGNLSFKTVTSASLVFDSVVRAADNTVIARKSVLTLALGQELDLDGNGSIDIRYVKTERKNLDASLLTFVSSQDKKYATMFGLLPESIPGGRYPSGIAGLNHSGKLLVVEDPNAAPVSRGGSPALSLILEEGDFVIDPANNASPINRITSVSQTRSSVTYSSEGADQREMARKAFELLYMEVEGFTSELYNTPRTRGTYGIFDTTFNVNQKFASYFTVNANIHVDLDIYLSASLSIGFLCFDASLSAYPIVDSDITGYLKYEREFKKEDEKAKLLCHPVFTFSVGPVPVTVDVPLYLGYEAKASASLQVDYGIHYDGKFGFKNLKARGWVDWGIPKIEITNPSLVNEHTITFDNPVITGLANLNVYLFVFADADVAVAAVLHGKLPSKFGVEGDLSKSVTSVCTIPPGCYYYCYPTCTTVVGPFVFKLNLLAKGEAKVGVGIDPFYLEADLPLDWKYRKNLYTKKF